MTNLKLKAAIAAMAFSIPALAEVAIPAVVEPTESTERTERTCADARAEAIFFREMAKTDGDTNPQLPEIPDCKDGDTVK